MVFGLIRRLRLGRDGGNPREKLLAELVAAVIGAHWRLYRRPVRSLSKLASLLALFAYLNPSTGRPRRKPLRLDLEFYLDGVKGSIVSAKLPELLEDALDEKLVNVKVEPCPARSAAECDEPLHVYVVYPGKAKPRRLPRRILDEVEALVARYGRLDAKTLTSKLLEALGVKASPSAAAHGTPLVPLEEVIGQR